MWSIIYISLAIFFFLFYYKRNRDVFHPCSLLLVIWLLGCAISNIELGARIVNVWSLEMHFVCIVSSLSIFIGSLPFIMERKFALHIKGPVPSSYAKILYLLFIMCTICFMLEWYLNGFKILVFETNSGVDLKSDRIAIPGVHYGTILLPFLAIWSFYKIINDQRYFTTTTLILVFIIVVYCLFANISRGDLLTCFCGILFIYSRYVKIDVKKIGLILLLFIIIIIGVALVRIQNETSVIYTTTDNPYFSIIYSYVVTCYANLNDYINARYPYHLFGNLTFSPLWTLTGSAGELPAIMIDQMGVFNAKTYLYDFYHDFKFFGIILFPFIIGVSLSYLYKISLCGTRYWILLLAVMQKAILVPFFGNYFFGEFVFIFPYLVTLLFILFLKKYKRIVFQSNKL